MKANGKGYTLFLLSFVCLQFGTLGVTSAASYYVATDGSDSVTAEQARNINTPKRTLARAVTLLKPGDTLFVRGGTYAESLHNTVPPGGSWRLPVVVRAYANEQVVLRPASGKYVFVTYNGGYIILESLILDGTNITADVVGITYDGASYAHHIRLRNCEIRNGPRTGIGIHQGSSRRTDSNEFIGCKIHDNGRSSDFAHGLYLESSKNLIDGCQVYSNSGWGVQVYTGVAGWPVNNNTICNSTFHSNARAGLRGVGIGVYNGSNNRVYNNVVYNNAGGITINFGARNTLIYNNTVYANNAGSSSGNRYGIYNGNDSDVGRVGSTAAMIRNNIAYGNTTNFKNSRTDASVANNLIGADPKFVNAGQADFHLQEASPAINRGTTTAPVVTADKEGVARPQGSAYDIGAYEFLAPPPSTPDAGWKLDEGAGSMPPWASPPSATPSTVQPFEPVIFKLATQGSCTWDFGDGTFEQGTTVSHAYSAPGVFSVVVQVEGNSVSYEPVVVSVVSAAGEASQGIIELGTAPLNKRFTTSLWLEGDRERRGVRWKAVERSSLPPGTRVVRGCLAGQPVKAGTYIFDVNIHARALTETRTYRLSITE